MYVVVIINIKKVDYGYELVEIVMVKMDVEIFIVEYGR